jgi:GNAT superfamily N-acetyltransferase
MRVRGNPGAELPERDAASASLPALEVLVDVADRGLHPWVRTHVGEEARRVALAEEIDFWLNTAARDLEHARGYAEVAPRIGEPVEAYLDRWLGLASGGHVLAGPRYLGLDPDLPFVGVSGSDRPLVQEDRESLVGIARRSFAAFKPGFVMVESADPVGAWPDTGAEMRQVVGKLEDLRRLSTPPELSVVPRRDTGFYGDYRQIHDRHVAEHPAHARRARCETEEDLATLADHGLVYDVLVGGAWAGILAAEPGVRRGVRGATVVELLLDHPHRGRGHGKHLSALLAQALPMPDHQCLLGTIHADNATAYRSALAAGRVDVGGEVRIPV